jgi:hypothetical protein
MFISILVWMLTTTLNFFQIERQSYFIYVLWICALTLFYFVLS